MEVLQNKECIAYLVSLVWKNFIHIKKKLYKKDKAGKQNTTQQQKKNIDITMYNYKLYTIARLVPNKSIQAVQLIY